MPRRPSSSTKRSRAATSGVARPSADAPLERRLASDRRDRGRRQVPPSGRRLCRSSTFPGAGVPPESDPAPAASRRSRRRPAGAARSGPRARPEPAGFGSADDGAAPAGGCGRAAHRLRTAGVLGLLAIAIASVGLYGVATYAVAQRRRDRTPDGPREPHPERSWRGSSGRASHSSPGVGIGVVAALAATRLLRQALCTGNRADLPGLRRGRRLVALSPWPRRTGRRGGPRACDPIDALRAP